MSAFIDENEPRKVQRHEIGQDLSLLSVADIDERISLLKGEIERLVAAQAKKQASKSAADAFFRKG
jgi:uncharacterized small protein (DUF1192 family)